MGEVCDEYTCHECDIDKNARSVIIIDNGYNAHMFSDLRVFHNFCTKTGIQVKCANGQLIEPFSVGDAGFLTNSLGVPQLKTNLISKGKLALSGWKTLTCDRVKEVYDKRWNKIIEAVIQNDAQPLHMSTLSTSLSRRAQTCPNPIVNSREQRLRE